MGQKTSNYNSKERIFNDIIHAADVIKEKAWEMVGNIEGCTDITITISVSTCAATTIKVNKRAIPAIIRLEDEDADNK